MEEAARWLDGIKSSYETAEVAATAAVQTRLGGYGNGSGRRCKLGVNIAAKRLRQDNRNGGSDGIGGKLVWIGGSCRY